MNKTQVIFEYEPEANKWEVYVTNVSNELKALKAFNSVILTCEQATPEIEFNKAKLVEGNKYKISIGILFADN